MSTTSNSSRPSTGSQQKEQPNPLIRQDFELTEELTKYVEVGYGSCEMDMQGNVKAENVREVFIKLWLEQDRREEQGDQGDQDKGVQDKDKEKDQGKTSKANSRATSRAGSKKQQKDGQSQDEEKDEERLKAVQIEVDVIMKQVEEAAYKAMYGINEADNIMKKAQIDLTKEQFVEAAGTVFWVRCANIVLLQLFKVFDDDGDGYIEAKDLCRVMEEVDNPLKPDELRGMMETADHDGDRKITFDEFKEVMMKQYT